MIPPTVLSAANIAAYPAWTPNSVIAVQCGPGTGTLTIQVTGTYVGQIAVGSSLDLLAMMTYPSGSITQSAVSGATGIPANGNGKFTVPVDAGTAYVYFSSYSSGTPTVAASWGSGSGENPGSNGGGAANVASSLSFQQVIIATTGTAVQCPNMPAINGVRVTAHPLNASPTKVTGGTVGLSSVTNATTGTGNGELIQPGQSMGYGASNANLLYLNGTAGDIYFVSTP